MIMSSGMPMARIFERQQQQAKEYPKDEARALAAAAFTAAAVRLPAADARQRLRREHGQHEQQPADEACEDKDA